MNYADQLHFIVDSALYRLNQNEVFYFYITILPQQKKGSNGKKLTFKDLLANNDKAQKKVKLNIIFQEGDIKGPKQGLFGYNQKVANANFRQRGATTRLAPQKSFKIKLKKKAGAWKNLRYFNLNKHPWDYLRIRNKLCFDVFTEIDHITSLQTNFVHLFIKDLSETKTGKFVDYGLFTNIEDVKDNYLSSHGLDIKGDLYKANDFAFKRYSSEIKKKGDSSYDRDSFETRLEIIQASDHKKLVNMLDDLNNSKIEIETVINKHFNRDNYLTWLAINILFENTDTMSQNFFLYSPSNSSTWFFLPWDYDGGFGIYETPWATMERAEVIRLPIFNYWSSPLHRKFFKNKKNREDLLKLMEKMVVKHLSSKKLLKQIHKLSALTEPIIFSNPDLPNNYYLENCTLNNRKTMRACMENEYTRIAAIPGQRLSEYKKVLKMPTPTSLYEPIIEKNKVKFVWRASGTFDGQSISYEFLLGTSPDLKKPIIHHKNLKKNRIYIPKPQSEHYFWKIIVTDSGGDKIESRNYYYDEKKQKKYFGLREWIH